jgi:hypothetical protein
MPSPLINQSYMVLKTGYSFTSYNEDGEYIQRIDSPDGSLRGRSKSIGRRHGSFSQSDLEFVKEVMPEALEPITNYEVICNGHPEYGDINAGDCWIKVFDGLSYRAYKKVKPMEAETHSEYIALCEELEEWVYESYPYLTETLTYLDDVRFWEIKLEETIIWCRESSKYGEITLENLKLLTMKAIARL